MFWGHCAMGLPATRLLAGLICVAALAGCARTTLSGHGSRAVGRLTPSEPLERVAAPKPVSLKSLALPKYEAVDRALSKRLKPAGYRVLPQSQCRCLAAGNSMLGNLLAAESQSLTERCTGRRDHDATARAVLADALAYRSVEERNRSAGAALELYFRLAEAYHGRDQLERSIEAVRESIRQLQQAKEAGVSVPTDDAPLRREQLDLQGRSLELQATIHKLDRQLSQLLGLEADETQPLWPAPDLKVTISPIDVEDAVSTGLASRADLALLVMLEESLSSQTLPAMRGAMARLDPLLASLAPRRQFLGAALYRGQLASEAETRRLQLEDLLAERRRAAEDEIRRAAADAELRLRLVGLAADKLDQWQKQLQRLRESREAKGTVSMLEISTAQLEVIRAESDALHAVIEWQIALVKLEEAQGILAAECGYPLPSCPCDSVATEVQEAPKSEGGF